MARRRKRRTGIFSIFLLEVMSLLGIVALAQPNFWRAVVGLGKSTAAAATNAAIPAKTIQDQTDVRGELHSQTTYQLNSLGERYRGSQVHWEQPTSHAVNELRDNQQTDTLPSQYSNYAPFGGSFDPAQSRWETHTASLEHSPNRLVLPTYAGRDY